MSPSPLQVGRVWSRACLMRAEILPSPILSAQGSLSASTVSRYLKESFSSFPCRSLSLASRSRFIRQNQRGDRGHVEQAWIDEARFAQPGAHFCECEGIASLGVHEHVHCENQGGGWACSAVVGDKF